MKNILVFLIATLSSIQLQSQCGTLSFGTHSVSGNIFTIPVHLLITDQNGQVVRQQKYDLPKGEQILQLSNLGDLHNGTYYYQLWVGDDIATGKFIKTAKK